jgi:Dehydrogenases with different specificities (related to short-chain alcohol dehydrogenases)
MELGLSGKSAFVAAGSKGLGRACAAALAKEGARVTIASRSLDDLQAAGEQIRSETGAEVHIVQMDVTNADDIVRAVEEAARKQGGLDVLITNAGGPPPGRLKDLADDDWSSGFQLTLMSAIRLIRAAVPYMEAAGGGRIVNIASSSIKQPIPELLLSNVFRAGIASLTKSLATELGSSGILINTVAPGRIATDRLLQLDERRAREKGAALEEILEETNAGIPLGRTGTPEEFARVAAFYGSFANTYVTGQSLLVDGGMVKAL